MREAGCTTVSFGLESGNQEILKTVKKGTKLPGIIEAVEACREAGVAATGSFIVGLPGETPETMLETVRFSQRLGALGAQTGFHMLAPFPGTAVREEADKYKLKILSNDWSQYHANHAITETPGASQHTQEELALRFDQVARDAFFELAARVKEGRASTEDQARYAHVERAAIVYDIMRKDLVETRGSFQYDRSPLSQARAVALFAAEVHAATDQPQPAVEATLRHGLEQGWLRYRAADGVASFTFADSDAALAVTEVARTVPLGVRDDAGQWTAPAAISG
jgi:hypothetical protein